VPLYLEWAPQNLLAADKKPKPSANAEKSKVAVGEKQVKRAVVETQVAALDEDDDVEQARSVFVKNLNFSTTEASVKKHFEQKISQGAVRSVTVRFTLWTFLFEAPVHQTSVAVMQLECVWIIASFEDQSALQTVFCCRLIAYKHWCPLLSWLWLHSV